MSRPPLSEKKMLRASREIRRKLVFKSRADVPAGGLWPPAAEGLISRGVAARLSGIRRYAQTPAMAPIRARPRKGARRPKR